MLTEGAVGYRKIDAGPWGAGALVMSDWLMAPVHRFMPGSVRKSGRTAMVVEMTVCLPDRPQRKDR
ncbi:hypothetical protein KCP73_17270 [Salmonella enterica subsp. enterica]|nr:hypothetical protein KCP73_17270 [Salmonella enterica subsp. enterica]